MDVVSLLDSKTRSLRRFLELSTEFLSRLPTEGLAGLPDFEARRDSAIKTLELLDRKINSTLAALPREERLAIVERVRLILGEQETVIEQIFRADQGIMERIESEKTQLLDQLATSRKSQTQIGKYKSAWMPESGEELDRKL